MLFNPWRTDWAFLEPDTGLDHCPRILLLCFTARISAVSLRQNVPSRAHSCPYCLSVAVFAQNKAVTAAFCCLFHVKYVISQIVSLSVSEMGLEVHEEERESVMAVLFMQTGLVLGGSPTPNNHDSIILAFLAREL